MIPKTEKKEAFTNAEKENKHVIQVQHPQITNHPNEIAPKEEIKSKQTIIKNDSEKVTNTEWESKTCFWSSIKKDGYRYAPNKKAWYKKKELTQENGHVTSGLNDNNNKQEDILTTTKKIICYFNLYKSGVYVMTKDAPLKSDYVIPINSNFKNGYLLQCYKSGHINKVLISTLLSKRIGKEYMNGLNKNDVITNIELIDSEKIIGIYFTENGIKKFKAHLTEKISSRDQLHLQGYKVMYMDFESINYKIMPLEILDNINRLVFQSFTANGKPIDNDYYDAEWSIIKSYDSKDLPTDKKEFKEVVKQIEFYTPSLFDSRVELNSVVEIKYFNNNKTLRVKLVESQTKITDKLNGIQNINTKSPLALSILGKTIGDIVKVGTSENKVEIIKIEN